MVLEQLLVLIVNDIIGEFLTLVTNLVLAMFGIQA